MSRRAIRASGGLTEAFTLPVIMIVPGVCLGAFGGLGGSASQRIVRRLL